MDVTLLKTTKMGQKDLRLMSNLAVMTMLLYHAQETCIAFCFHAMTILSSLDFAQNFYYLLREFCTV